MEKSKTTFRAIACSVIIACNIALIAVVMCWMGVFLRMHTGALQGALKAAALPARTEMLETKSWYGKLSGNGDGADFLVTAVIKSELTLSELQSWYGAKGYIVDVQSSKRFYSDRYKLSAGEYDCLTDIDDFAGYYTVYSFTHTTDGLHNSFEYSIVQY